MANSQTYMNFSKAEIQASQYYIHRSYIPSYYYAYISLEKWIAENIFRNDLSRVFMASNEYAFRRRFELTDMSQDFEKISASSLRFPFANYNILNSGWVADTRAAANTAAMVYQGIYVGSTKLRTASVVVEIPTVFYFDREDDARLAYDKLLFFTYNEHYYSMEVGYGSFGTYPDGTGRRGLGETLLLPFNLEVKNLAFNPKYKEDDWLKQNRIFTIEVRFSVRTYTVYPPDQPDYNLSVDTSGRLIDENGTVQGLYGDGSEHYYTVEDVVLNLMQATQQAEGYYGLENFPRLGKKGVYYIDTSISKEQEGTKEHPKTRLLKAYIWNSDEEKYVEVSLSRKDILNTYDVALDSLGVNGVNSEGSVKVSSLKVKDVKESEGTLTWTYDRDYDTSKLSKIQIALNSKVVFDSQDVQDLRSYTFKNLSSESTYEICISFYSADGSVCTFYEELTTKIGSEVKKNRTPESALIGTTW